MAGFNGRYLALCNDFVRGSADTHLDKVELCHMPNVLPAHV